MASRSRVVLRGVTVGAPQGFGGEPVRAGRRGRCADIHSGRPVHACQCRDGTAGLNATVLISEVASFRSGHARESEDIQEPPQVVGRYSEIFADPL